MITLTAFQKQCGTELTAILRMRNCEPRTWDVVKGHDETYIEVDLGSIKLWIYEDGACWQGDGRDRVFEAIDYDSLDDLQQAFLADIRLQLEGK